ncbi:uncharacterized protein JN550_012059 [Neoarthrinium moseri]|uniref:uncharacterized protein n=1 Tax=Neoarthrinium moseri TaxID=1658444 RepID=UPI001FDB4233|nr:uncharacterized protein JN550_012059 [Neoarthrinium moseri]KAI1859541.1 hypothetical protein JN550_012059 [Neoarthrinium moseri]
MENSRETSDTDTGLRISGGNQPESDNQQEEKDAIVTSNAQHGVQAIEAAAGVWGKWDLIAAYGLIWLIYFVTSINEVVVRALNPFVTSSFALHSLTATSTVFSSIIGGLSKIPLAKIIDIWGRPQGISLMLFFWVIGFIMMAACRNVETYAAALVFSTVGAQGVSYCLTVFVADTSALKNRALMLSFATSPYIVTTWIGGPMADAFMAGPGWRWGFGVFAIIVPAVVIPFIVLFMWNQRKAKKMGLVPETAKKSLKIKDIKRLAIEFDLLGVLILAAGMALFLLPMNIYSYQSLGWKSPMIISMTVVGGLLIIAFALYERFWAPVSFIPMHLLLDRTVFFAGLMLVFVFFNSAVWGAYFNSMLMVVWNQSLTKATYISNIYRVGSCFSALVLGFFMRWTGRFKWVAVYFALPLMLLGVGLMIQFRQPYSDIGLIVMTQIFVAFSGGPIVTSAELAMMAPSDHQHIAAILAVLDLFGSIGTALGSTVSAAIWTGVFPAALEKYLPEGSPVDLIYSSIYVQLGYRVGTPIRVGISYAYAEAQRYMLITAVSLLGAAYICAWMWRDIKLKDIHQVKGNVV